MCSKTFTATIEQMSEMLQSSVSQICSKHFEFNQCVTIIGAICINVDNDPSDVIIKFNDCITKADLYRMAKEDCENSEYARVAEKIVLSSQLLAALKGLDDTGADIHHQQQQQQQHSVEAGSSSSGGSSNNNKRKRKRSNPHRRLQLRLRDGASLDASRSSEDLDDNDNDEEEDAEDEHGTAAEEFQQENNCEDEDLPDGQLQMNLETAAEDTDCPDRVELTLTNRVSNREAINGDYVNEEDDDDDIEYLGESFVDTKAGLFQANLVQPTGPSLIRLQQQQQQPQPSIKLTLSLSGVGNSGASVAGGGGGPTQASELDLRALNNKLKGALGAKVFKCDYCGKAFNRKFCLERHERLHTGVRPYACQICGERYIRLEDQKRHMRSSHPDDFRDYMDDDDLVMAGSPV